MIIHQMLYGYSEGHRLIASSFEPDDSVNWELVRKTDRPSVAKSKLISGVTFGFPVGGGNYALCRTWEAKEVSRPGAVWTHVLLIPNNLISPVAFTEYLRKPSSSDVGAYTAPIDYNKSHSFHAFSALSPEATRLLLLLSSKPQAALNIVSESDPVKLLLEINNFDIDFLQNRPFSSCFGKADISASSNSVVFLSKDDLVNNRLNFEDISSVNYQIPSPRINDAWNVLDRSESALYEWIRLTLPSLRPSVSNLKVCFEALLLGREKLDDAKLLGRIYAATVFDSSCSLLKFSLGEEVFGFQSPQEWISATYLLSLEEWGEWKGFSSPEHVADAVLCAPLTILVNSVVGASGGGDSKEALDIIAHRIERSMFRQGAEASAEFAKVLIKYNRELVYSLPNKSIYADAYLHKYIYREAESIEKEVEFASRAPGFVKGFLLKGLRLSRGDQVFIDFAMRKMSSGEWKSLKKSIRDFCISTPGFVESIVFRDNVDDVFLGPLYNDLGDEKLNKIMLGYLYNRKNVENISSILVAHYGADKKIPLSDFRCSALFPELILEVSGQRLERSGSKKVVKRIVSDITKYLDIDEVLSRSDNVELVDAIGEYIKHNDE